jgi:hypothetical protein
MIPKKINARYIKYKLLMAILLTTYTGFGQVRILFDATKAEMAGNADWVIDADQTTLGISSSGPYITSSGHQSNPQQIPTPAQSGITSSTAENYWTGALSAWAVDCVKKGYAVETLPWNGQITYGNTSNAQDLSHYKVYIIDEPNLVFSSSEKTAIIQFVQNGGSLFIISDHNNSDRNGDGWDSPNIWNDLFSNNSISSNPFGITFDLNDFSQTTTNISATSADSIIHGPMGNVAMAQWSGGTTMTLDQTKNPTIKGVLFKSGTTPGNTNVMVAYGRYGSGKIAAIGDSSPTDDGTGNPNCTLYTGYFGDASGNHQLLLMNITIWLATTSTTSVESIQQDHHISIFPNPSAGNSYLKTDVDLTNVSVYVYDLSGKMIEQEQSVQLKRNEPQPLMLSTGIYFVRVVSDQTTQTSKMVVNR